MGCGGSVSVDVADSVRGAAGATAINPGEMLGRCLDKYVGESGGAIAMGDGERGALVMFLPPGRTSAASGSPTASPLLADGSARNADPSAAAIAPSASPAAAAAAATFSISYVSKRSGALFALEDLGEAELARLKKAAGMEQVSWALFIKSIAADIVKNKVRCDVRGDGAAVLHFSIHLSKTNETTSPFALKLPEIVPSLDVKDPATTSHWKRAHQRLFVEPSIRVVSFRRSTAERREKELKMDEIARVILNAEPTHRALRAANAPRAAEVLRVREQADAVSRSAVPGRFKVRALERRVEFARGNAQQLRQLDDMYERGGVFPTRSIHLLRSAAHTPLVVVPSSPLVQAIRKAAGLFVSQARERNEPLMPSSIAATASNAASSSKTQQRQAANPSLTWQQTIAAATAASTQQQEERIANAVVKALTHLDEWAFDIFELDAASGGNALFCMTLALLLKLDLVAALKINLDRFVAFLAHIQAGYHPNPYHNATHAADVTHVLYYILSKGGLAEKCKLSPCDLCACILAAAVHDYDHPGFNNSFHTRTNAYLSTLYNERSVLENHHLACTFEILRHPSLNIFCDAADDDRRAIRDTMVDMVLSTDMGRHQTIFDAFRSKLGEATSWSGGGDPEAKSLALSMAIKMADVSNTVRPRNLYMPWVQNLCNEFYNQGDNELDMGLPISPFMNRAQHSDLPRGQVSFINFVIIPMFDACAQFLPNMRICCDIARANREYWQTMQVQQ